MTFGTIFDIKKFALHDGPGLRTTVFFKGCPLSCGWCHNPEGISPKPHRIYRPERCIGCKLCVEACPESALVLGEGGVTHNPRLCLGCLTCGHACPAEAVEFIGRSVTVDQVLAEVEKDRAFYDESGGGVTFSGGEPVMQPDFLMAVLDACGARDLHRTVDTTGYAPQDVMRKVARRTELLLYDLKHMDSQRHRELTGVPNESILANLKMLIHSGTSLWVRLPLIPGFNDDIENLSATGRFLSGLPNPPPMHILPFHGWAKGKYRRLAQSFAVAAIRPTTDEQMITTARFLSDFGLQVVLGGESHDPSCCATA